MDAINQVGEILESPDLPFEVVPDWICLHQKSAGKAARKRLCHIAPGFGICDVNHKE